MAAIRKRTWVHNDRKRSAYEFTLYANGKRVRRQFPTRAEAQAALDAFRDELKNPKPIAATLTLGTAIDRVLELKARSASSTQRDYARIGRHLKDEFGTDTPLIEITAGSIAAYEGKRLAATRIIGKGDTAIARPLSLSSINRPKAFLRHVLMLAQEWGELTAIPRIKTAKEPSRLRWLREEEAEHLLEACERSGNKALADLVAFALHTGLRQSEALGLTWPRVDRATGVIHLDKTKNGDRRSVALDEVADAVLARRWAPNATGYVFGSSNWNSFRSAWETAVRAARLEDVRFHTLRHTCASWLVQSGVSLQEVQRILGHRTLAMTMRYAHLAPESQRTAIAKLNGKPGGRKLGARTSSAPTVDLAPVLQV
jgi:integrase